MSQEGSMVLGSTSGEGLRELTIMTEGEREPACHMVRTGVRERSGEVSDS